MVFQLQFWNRNWLEVLIDLRSFVGILGFFLLPSQASGNEAEVDFKKAFSAYQSQDYFQAASLAFQAMGHDDRLKSSSYALIARSLMAVPWPQSASYFFIRALQMQHKQDQVSVLTQTQDLLDAVGVDLLRKYLVKYTEYEDYDEKNLSAYLYALGKESLLKGETQEAIRSLGKIQDTSSLWPYSLQLKGTSYALLGEKEAALSEFQLCEKEASRITRTRQSQDLKSRCLAGQARTLYEMNRFQEADHIYGLIPKKSIVWPDVLFEQAWNFFSRSQFHRSLGKLIAYQNPLLSFVFNSEQEVLEAQSYWSLCYFPRAMQVILKFNKKYTSIGQEIKNFLKIHENQMDQFYRLGKSSLRQSIHTSGINKVLNRFIRSSYFESFVESEKRALEEEKKINNFISKKGKQKKFFEFLKKIIQWRLNTIHFLGGAFIKNSLIDYYSDLISNFEKISFIKIEILKYEKEIIINNKRDRHKNIPQKFEENFSDYLYWNFNEEFWIDELGDYVFDIHSNCNH